MLKKISKKIEEKHQSILHKKLEKRLIASFREYTLQIKEDLANFNKSSQLLNAIALTDSFREVCAKIGNDKLKFHGYRSFLNCVRQADREIAKTISWMKNRYELNNPEKFRVENKKSVNYTKYILKTLDSIIDEFEQEKKERKLNKDQKDKEKLEENKKKIKNMVENNNEDQKKNIVDEVEKFKKYSENIPLILKTKLIIHYLKHPEEKPENQIIIEKYRKNLTSSKKNDIKKKLDKKDEYQILKEFIKEITEKIQSYEILGFYNHLSLFASAFLNNLENISEKFEDTFSILSFLRQNYRKMENWLSRANKKYKNTNLINPKEPKINSTIEKETKVLMKKYLLSREEFKITAENHRILKINSKNNKHKRREKRKNKIRAKKEDIYKKIKLKISTYKQNKKKMQKIKRIEKNKKNSANRNQNKEISQETEKKEENKAEGIKAEEKKIEKK